MAEKTWIKINGVWTEVTTPKVNINSSWKNMIPYVRVGGVWKPCLSSGVQYTWTEMQPRGNTTYNWGEMRASGDLSKIVVAGTHYQNSAYLSTNGGSTWTELFQGGDPGFPNVPPGRGMTISIDGGTIMCTFNFATQGAYTTNNGSSWTTFNLPHSVSGGWRPNQISTNGQRFICGVYDSDWVAYYSPDRGVNWEVVRDINDPNTTFSNVLPSRDGQRMTGDGGNGWVLYNSTFDATFSFAYQGPNGTTTANAMAMNNNGTVFYLRQGNRIYKMSESLTEELMPMGDVDGNWRWLSLSDDQQTLVAQSTDHLFISVDGGSSWTQQDGVGGGFRKSVISSDGKTILTESGNRLYKGVAPS